jgi:guanylate cyclase
MKRNVTMAPELLQINFSSGSNNNNVYFRGTQKGDVYSFGILLYEIYGRNGPFGIGTLYDLQTMPVYNEIVEKLRNPQMHIRPSLNNFKSPDCIKETMQLCWQKDPQDRPDMRTIRLKLKELQWDL